MKQVHPSLLSLPPSSYSSLVLMGHIIHGKYRAVLYLHESVVGAIQPAVARVLLSIRCILYILVFSTSLEPNTTQQLILQTATLKRWFYKLGQNFSKPGFPQLPVILPSV